MDKRLDFQLCLKATATRALVVVLLLCSGCQTANVSEGRRESESTTNGEESVEIGGMLLYLAAPFLTR